MALLRKSRDRYIGLSFALLLVAISEMVETGEISGRDVMLRDLQWPLLVKRPMQSQSRVKNFIPSASRFTGSRVLSAKMPCKIEQRPVEQ